jgi:hypothetical protein
MYSESRLDFDDVFLRAEMGVYGEGFQKRCSKMFFIE